MTKPDLRSAKAKAYRHFYKTPEWQRLRKATADRDLHTCQMCKRWAGQSYHCDHIKDHKGDTALFFNPANLRTLCAPCHNRHAQREAHGTARRPIGLDGWPVP